MNDENVLKNFKKIVSIEKNINSRKSTFCIIPWINSSIDPDSKYSLCCNMRNEKKINLDENFKLEELINNEYALNIRNKMLNNEYIEECKMCYQNESITKRSFRTHNNESNINLVKKIKKNGSVKISLDDILIIDYRLTNKCNFACRTCNPKYSSRWEKILKKEKNINTSSNIVNYIKEKKINPKIFYFAGGEPLISDYHWEIIDFLIEEKKFDVNICYNTNLSILNYKGNDFIEKLKHFNTIGLSVSCDSLYLKGEYIRTGFKHQNFINNIRKLEQNNFNYSLTTVISFLNLIYMNDFFNDLHNNNINQNINFIILTYSREDYHIYNIPDRVFNKVIFEIDKIIQNNNVNQKNKNFFIDLKKSLHEKRFFNEKYFIHKNILPIKRQDKLFNNMNIKDYLPELYDLIKIYF